jgi:heat shock protein HslJ
MPTDLETSIREALHARAAEVVPKQIELRGRRGHRWVPPALAAAAVLLLAVTISLVVTRKSDDDTGPAAASPAAAVVGYSWRLDRVAAPGIAAFNVPSGLRATLAFEPGGHLQGDDTVNALFSTYRLDAQGFRLVGDSGSTLVGGLPGDRARDAVAAAIGAVFYQSNSGHPDVAASVHGAVLTLHARGYTLTMHRGHAVTDDPAPSPTPTRTTRAPSPTPTRTTS